VNRAWHARKKFPNSTKWMREWLSFLLDLAFLVNGCMLLF
jgi:hypothetical protein